jgi:ATP-binding cassette subfamily B protein
LEAKPGEKIALLGGPGSGKTSLVHLIPRFYDVTNGSIEIDGIGIREITLKSLRKNIGLVMQDVFMFSSSIGENISYGVPNATIDEIKHASAIAQLDNFITSLPNGYETQIGERGITLSGGQKQRLAIARTLLLNPPILILDDATSSIDAATENLLQNDLKKVMQGRTVFIITNRLNSILEADQIFVLSKGLIVQNGNHRDLISQKGLYSDMYQIQFNSGDI